MVVLVINNGSTSSRFSVVNITTNETLAHGGAERIGTNFSTYNYINNRGITLKKQVKIYNCIEAIEMMIDYIFDTEIGVLDSLNNIDAIGHRVVHGGEKYTTATFINDEVLKDIKRYSIMAPIHNLKSLESIEICKNKFKEIQNIAIFDTSFHSTIPKENFLYAIPGELYTKYKIRKYGFHGISYNYVLDRYCKLTQNKRDNVNIVACHLGGGSSICAIKNGKSFDTTMGYTPLSGMIMASRSGNIDPSVLMRMMDIYNISIENAIKILNESSGYLAICGDSDIKSIVDKSENDDENAIFLRNMINKDFKKNLLSMMANMETVDSIILTGGIGSKNISQREMLLSNLEQFGLKLDKSINNEVYNFEKIISDKNSNIPIYVIPDNEELEIANQCRQLVMEKK